jgi:transposase
MKKEKQNHQHEKKDEESFLSLMRKFTPEEWACMEEILPEARNPSRQKIANQKMVEALVYRCNTHTPWRKLPKYFGSWQLIYKRYERWRENGILMLVYDKLQYMGFITKEVQHTTQEQEEGLVIEEVPNEWWELTDEEWESIEMLFPPDSRRVYGNSRYKTNRQMINAILYREYSQCDWRSMPAQLGHWRTVYNRFARWNNDGTLQKVFDRLESMGVIKAKRDLYSQNDDSGEDISRNWWELTDEQWEHISSFLPPDIPHNAGKQPKTNRQMLDAILCRYRTNATWRELPEKYGHWRTINNRYTRWRDDGTLQRVFDELKRLGILLVD